MGFSNDLKAFAAKTNENVDAVTSEVVIEIGARLVMRSPVGDRERWAINDLTTFKREAYQSFLADSGKKRVTTKTLGKMFPTVGPVGYAGGRFRANWQYGFNSAPTGDLPDIDKSGQMSIDRIRSGVTGHATAGIHYIANNLPYAQRLEDGWSKQAPNGMVGLTVIEFQGVVRNASTHVK